jgi:hypothetical protein
MPQRRLSMSPASARLSQRSQSAVLVAQVNFAKSLAVATLILGVISLCGFAMWPYFPAIGGLLAVIGCSFIICGEGRSPRSHAICVVLCTFAAIAHLIGLGMWLYYYVVIVRAVDESNEGDESIVIVAYWIGIFLWPVIAVSLVCFILEVCQAVNCVKARNALMNQTGMYSVGVSNGRSDPRQNPGAPYVVAATPVAAPTKQVHASAAPVAMGNPVH